MALTEAKGDGPSVADIEAGFVAAWPALRTIRDGSWLWRFAKGHTKRANAIQSHDFGDDQDADARIARLADLSREAGIRPTFRVTPLAGPNIGKALDRLGWDHFEPSHIMAMQMIGESHKVEHRAQITAAGAPEWLDGQCALQDYDLTTRAVLSEIIAAMPQSARGISIVSVDGSVVGSVLCVVVDELAMFTNVVTHQHYRRQGVAMAAMGAALNCAASLGAQHAAIHVLQENAPAQALYRGLGFIHRGSYEYRREPLR